MEEKAAPTWFYGLVGVAAVGAISLLLVSAILFGGSPNKFELTTVAPPPQEQPTR
jgi:hypothetical protein